MRERQGEGKTDRGEGPNQALQAAAASNMTRSPGSPSTQSSASARAPPPAIAAVHVVVAHPPELQCCCQGAACPRTRTHEPRGFVHTQCGQWRWPWRLRLCSCCVLANSAGSRASFTRTATMAVAASGSCGERREARDNTHPHTFAALPTSHTLTSSCRRLYGLGSVRGVRELPVHTRAHARTHVCTYAHTNTCARAPLPGVPWRRCSPRTQRSE